MYADHYCAAQNMQDCSKHWIWTMGSLSSSEGQGAGITREQVRVIRDTRAQELTVPTDQAASPEPEC